MSSNAAGTYPPSLPPSYHPSPPFFVLLHSPSLPLPLSLTSSTSCTLQSNQFHCLLLPYSLLPSLSHSLPPFLLYQCHSRSAEQAHGEGQQERHDAAVARFCCPSGKGEKEGEREEEADKDDQNISMITTRYPSFQINFILNSNSNSNSFIFSFACSRCMEGRWR